jgi:hypothetical protein
MLICKICGSELLFEDEILLRVCHNCSSMMNLEGGFENN